MAQSFVPQNTKVICTYMTNGTPLEIKATRSYIVIHSDKDHPLLTVVDNKISDTFGCKAPAKFWGGLQALCIGLAIGAAIVLTSGLAAAVIITALACSIYAGGTAIYTMAHACDATLKVQWKAPHDKVLIQGQKAILHHSYLECPTGGIVNLVMDPELAAEAAAHYSTNNNEEVIAQMTSQLIIGTITAATAGEGCILAGGLAIALYGPAEYAAVQPNKIVSNAATTNIGGAVIADGTTALTHEEAAIFNKNVGNLIKGGYQTVVARTTGNVSQELEGAFRIALSNKNLSTVGEGAKVNGYGAIGGVLANITVGYVSDKIEEHLVEGVEKEKDEVLEKDEKKGINVVSVKK